MSKWDILITRINNPYELLTINYKLMWNKKLKPTGSFNIITFIYKDDTKTKTFRNIDSAISVLDADHEKIKTINWNWTRFTVEELLEADF